MMKYILGKWFRESDEIRTARARILALNVTSNNPMYVSPEECHAHVKGILRPRYRFIKLLIAVVVVITVSQMIIVGYSLTKALVLCLAVCALIFTLYKEWRFQIDSLRIANTMLENTKAQVRSMQNQIVVCGEKNE